MCTTYWTSDILKFIYIVPTHVSTNNVRWVYIRWNKIYYPTKLIGQFLMNKRPW